MLTSPAIPERITIYGWSVSVVQKSLGGPLGYYDRILGEIALEIAQPEAGKHVVLMHELIHFAADCLVGNGAICRQPAEKFVEGAAPILLHALVSAGLYSGLSERELDRFFRSQLPSPSAVSC